MTITILTVLHLAFLPGCRYLVSCQNIKSHLTLFISCIIFHQGNPLGHLYKYTLSQHVNALG